MQKTRLIVAVLLIISAGGLLYYQFTTNPWLVGRNAQHNGGPPQALPGHGPTPEQMRTWALLRKREATTSGPRIVAGKRPGAADAPEPSHHGPTSADKPR